MKLLPYQSQSVDWLQSRPVAFLALEQGLGKTIVASTEAQTPILVVCPASLKFNWLDELSKWRPELKVQVIRKASDPINPTSQAWIINYDILTRVELPQVQTLIADECHYAKSHKATRTKALSKLIRKTPRVRLLSGTPAPNRPIELWPLLYATRVTKLGWMEFGFRYCAGWKTPWNTYDFNGASRLDELYALLEPVMLRLTKAQVLPQLPPKQYKVIELDLPVDKREKALDIEAIERSPHNVAFEALADILHMNAQRKLPLAIQHIKDVLESENKVVVFANHTDIIEDLASALEKYGVVTLTGKTPQSKRQEVVKQFQTDDATRVFIGNIKAAGVGHTLTAASRVIFVESSWSPADLEQCTDRCHRIGQVDHVIAEILTIHRSIDAQMLHSAISKLEVISKIIKESKMENTNLQKLRDLLNEAVEIIDAEINAENTVEAEPDPKPEPKVASAPAPAEQKQKPTATIDNVRDALAKLIAAGKRTDASEILKSVGAGKISEVKEADYGTVVDAIEKALA